MAKSCCAKYSSGDKSADSSAGGGEISVCGNIRVEHVESDDPCEDGHCCGGRGSAKISSDKSVSHSAGCCEASVYGNDQVGRVESDDPCEDSHCCGGRGSARISSNKSVSHSAGCCEASVYGNDQVGRVGFNYSCEDSHCCGGGESTKIIAEADIGFGNTLYIRGAGCGLSWDKGVAMRNRDAKFWVFECDKCKGKGDFEYKFLINDNVWSTGDNFVANFCKKNIAAPAF